MKDIKNKTIEVGTIIVTRSKNPKLIGEVITILDDRHDSVEVIILDKRLQPLQTGNVSYRVKKFRNKAIKVYNPRKIKHVPTFNLGDVVRKKYINGRKRYGIIVGYIHPDGLYSSSYEKGYNGTDFLECVEVSKRGVTRKRTATGEIKKFTTTSSECKSCIVDLWHTSGIRIIDE